MNVYQRDLEKIITGISRRYSLWQVWQDFLEMSAIAVSNAVDLLQFDAREAAYMQTVNRYSREEATEIANALGCLVMALDTSEPTDVLGETFMALELGNKWHGQFFTPYCVSKMMAKMHAEDIRAVVDSKGFVSMNEPACGGGAMIIAIANAMRDAGMNPQQQLHVVAQDLDIKAVHMSFLQLSLLHIPAVVIHGNTLAMEERSHWYTPAHITGFWNAKLARGCTIEFVPCGTYGVIQQKSGAAAPANDNTPVQPIAIGQTFSLF